MSFKTKRGTYLRAYKDDAPAAAAMPAAPKPVNSEIWSDGQLLGRTTLKGGLQKQESFKTPFQKQQEAFNQGQMPSIQERLFNPSQDQQDSWQAIAQANKDRQMRMFNQDYDKAQNSLIQNLTQRGAFGGRSSGSSQVPYFANELAKTGAQQIANINDQYIADQQTARDKDYNYNSGLYNLLNNGMSNQLSIDNNNISNALTGFNAGNNFNLTNHQNQMNQWALQRAMRPQGGGTDWGRIAGMAGGAALGAFAGNPMLGAQLGGSLGGAL